ncbi:MAG: TolC family protein [Planctomycetes bacterium]|nr:TolC family protein [Planctomycetota bacterium]
MRRLLPLTLLLLAACHTSIKEVEPSESFRAALEEVMERQPNALKVKPDDLERRREPVILRLSLDDCIELAMAHNRAILFERLNAELAAAAVVGSHANLDFRVGGNIGYHREEAQIDARFFGDTRDKEITATTNYGINANLPFASGTTLDVSMGFVRRDTNNPFSTFEFFPTSTITVTQHLLNGVGLTPNLGGTWVAENDQLIANWQVEATRNEQAFNVAMAYWSLVEAEEELQVFRNQADLATDALSLARSRLEAEIGTRLDVLAQEANLKATQVSIIRAEALVDQRTDELLYAIHPDLIHGYALFSNYRVVIQPLTKSDSSRNNADAPTLMAEVKAALRRRPEIRQAAKRIESAGIRVEMGEYGLLPTLDLEGSFGNDGSGVTFDDSWESFFDFKNLNYGFNLNFSVPIQNSAARAALTQAEINKRSAILSARDTETTIILEVAQAVRNITTARRAVDAAEEAFRLQDETHDAEMERQKAGLATSFEVKQALNDLTNAELEVVKARIGMERSRLQLQKATGDMGR